MKLEDLVSWGESACRGTICRGTSSFWEELSTQQLSPRAHRAKPEAAAGDTEGP